MHFFPSKMPKKISSKKRDKAKKSGTAVFLISKIGPRDGWRVCQKALFPINFMLASYINFSLLEFTTLDTHNSQTTHRNWFKFWISQLNVISNGFETTPLNNYLLMIFMMTFLCFITFFLSPLRFLVCYRAHFSV